MCRIISISGKIEYESELAMLEKFQQLAEYGKTPKGLKAGHKDGWGIVVYEEKKLILFVKDHRNALKDPNYLQVLKSLKEKKPIIIIGHLRKASVGDKNIKNAHPFVFKNYSFCQNGTIFESEKILLENKFKKLVKGKTDSEKFFTYVLQSLDGHEDRAAIRRSIKKSVNYMRKNFDFTALNIIFSNGKYVWALREVNEKNKYVKRDGLMEYYTLFLGIKNKMQLICSEKIIIPNIEYRKINNHELLEIDTVNNNINIMKI